MKRTAVLLIFTLCISTVCYATEDYSFKENKQKHLLISAFLAAGAESILETHNEYSLQEPDRLNGIELIGYSTMIALIPGIIKESLDAQEDGNTWSNADLTYDLAGSLLGSTSSYFLHRYFDNDTYKIELTLNPKRQNIFITYNF